MKYLLVLFVALIAQSCSNEKIENDWTRDNLQGKVMSYSEFSYEAKERFGNIEKGERILIRWYRDLGHLPLCNQGKYAENGNRTEENWYKLDGSLDKKKTYEYGEKGNRIEENMYNSDGSLDSKKTYEYDEKGNRIEENWYKLDGSLSHKRKYNYDEKGYKIELYVYRSDGRAELVETYKYDKKGNKIECIGCGWDMTATGYNETHKYDEKGNIIEYKGILDNGFLHFKQSYEYEFDKQGNWIKQIEFLDGIPTYILERQYGYYD